MFEWEKFLLYLLGYRFRGGAENAQTCKSAERICTMRFVARSASNPTLISLTARYPFGKARYKRLVSIDSGRGIGRKF
jgi:hypothetical protein